MLRPEEELHATARLLVCQRLRAGRAVRSVRRRPNARACELASGVIDKDGRLDDVARARTQRRPIVLVARDGELLEVRAVSIRVQVVHRD